MDPNEKIYQTIIEALGNNQEINLDDINLKTNSSDILEQHKLKINYVNKSTNKNPEYATYGSSGFDLRANLTEPITINSRRGENNVAVIPTGLYFELPEGFEIQVRSRSGLAAKNSICVLNSPGTVDSDYRGEIKVILINHGLEDFVVQHGDRIAQAVIASVFGKNIVSLTEVKEISNDTQRSHGGFGHTGIK